MLSGTQTNRSPPPPAPLLLAGTTREHLGLALALKVPIFLVLSKVDLCSRSTVERTLRQLERVLKQPGCNKVPFLVTGPDDAVTAAQQFTQSTRYWEHWENLPGTLGTLSGKSYWEHWEHLLGTLGTHIGNNGNTYQETGNTGSTYSGQ